MSSASTPTAERIKNFKNKGKDSEELRRRRNEVSVELRKNKREDALSKRRNVCLDESFDGPLSPQQENNGQLAPLPSLEEIRRGIFSDDLGSQHIYTRAARKTLSLERNPPIETLVEVGVIPRLVSSYKGMKTLFSSLNLLGLSLILHQNFQANANGGRCRSSAPFY